MSYTSITQSKHLVELGLDPKTADCSYCLKGSDGNNEYYSYPDMVPVEDETDIPCWTGLKLFELLPDIENATPQLNKDFCYYQDEELDPIHPIAADSTVEAIYMMMEWVLENKYM